MNPLGSWLLYGVQLDKSWDPLFSSVMIRPSGFLLFFVLVLCVDFLTRIAIRTESSEWVRYPPPVRRLGGYERHNDHLNNDEDEDLVEQLKRQCCEWVACNPPRLTVG